jgi:hypothetical protein
MPAYSFTPNGGSEYFGGGGGWLSGLGRSFTGGLSAGFGVTNALRQMQDANAISPFAVSAAQSRLGEAALLGDVGRMQNTQELIAAAKAGMTDGNGQMVVPQPTTTELLAIPPAAVDPATLGSQYGTEAVTGAVTDPMLAGGLTNAGRMMGLPRYGFSSPLYNPSSMNYWGF